MIVSKDSETLKLLESTDAVKKRYEESAAHWTLEDLLSALDACNQCDIQYKSSKNQRLLVEVTLMQLCSLSKVQEEKKRN